MSESKENNVTGFSVLKSALAGLIGVQSRKNLERDFQSGKFWHFFIAGAIVTVVFAACVWLAVNLVLSSTP
ncbi:MAG: DUF2970 domain-containing protein [Thiolinea sp.]